MLFWGWTSSYPHFGDQEIHGHPRGEYHKRKSSKSRSKLSCGTYLRQLQLPAAVTMWQPIPGTDSWKIKGNPLQQYVAMWLSKSILFGLMVVRPCLLVTFREVPLDLSQWRVDQTPGLLTGHPGVGLYLIWTSELHFGLGHRCRWRWWRLNHTSTTIPSTFRVQLPSFPGSWMSLRGLCVRVPQFMPPAWGYPIWHALGWYIWCCDET